MHANTWATISPQVTLCLCALIVKLGEEEAVGRAKRQAPSGGGYVCSLPGTWKQEEAYFPRVCPSHKMSRLNSPLGSSHPFVAESPGKRSSLGGRSLNSVGTKLSTFSLPHGRPSRRVCKSHRAGVTEAPQYALATPWRGEKYSKTRQETQVSYRNSPKLSSTIICAIFPPPRQPRASQARG